MNTTLQEYVISSIKGNSLPYLPAIENPFVHVLPINNWNEFIWSSLFVGFFYYLTYFIVGGILEMTNPFPKN